eukprot:CAMPEP_0195520178 /NCGR_PEP_ID=MMETSP0794_2-20130614/16337_1 /TAXON_ID=515487 /ORGANISM="Stephanopyxis turris, Strain CCMP 815" /LENGTH=299 /DNA_ID=CAMNT_0040649475 /DNA_START=52 /DNA_END=951 /DNA_ORIENTATION=+
MVESLAGIETRHRKELKSLEGSKRADIKKLKSTKGKKGKEALATLEQDYIAKEQILKEKHANEILQFSTDVPISENIPSTNPQVSSEEKTDDNTATSTTKPQPPAATEEPPVLSQKEKKQAKARRKKERERQKELDRQAEIENELANAGPSRRDMEVKVLKELYLDPKNLVMEEVAADGHCLYRSIAAQCGDGADYRKIRNLCADTLASSEEEFAPFAETEGSYIDYVEEVRSSANWGGQLELRALARALRRPIVVYSAEATPLTMAEADADDEAPIQVSFHRHYYALGEHYNSVVPKG